MLNGRQTVRRCGDASVSESAEAGEPQVYVVEPGEAVPLDRDHLPDEFTVEMVSTMAISDIEWLEEQTNLTERQRTSLQAGLREAIPSLYGPDSLLKRLTRGWFSRPDPLTEDMRRSVAELVEASRDPSPIIAQPTSIPPPEEEGVVNRHNEQLAALQRLHDTNQSMQALIGQLVQRTEQQHRASERQKWTNWLLAGVAAASTIGTFATIQGSTRMWLALIVTVAFFGLLYVVMHAGPSD
jgi:hypothetical protein